MLVLGSEISYFTGKFETYLRYKQPAYTTIDATIGISMDKWYAQLIGKLCVPKSGFT